MKSVRRRGRWAWIPGLVLAVLPALASDAIHDLRGRVLDKPSVAPLANVAVTLLDTALGAVTGPDGSYRLAGVPDGVYQVLFEKDGYLDLQNVYDRRNIYYKYWDDGREKTIYFLPFLGLQAGF
jgi:hypothetical protein